MHKQRLITRAIRQDAIQFIKLRVTHSRRKRRASMWNFRHREAAYRQKETKGHKGLEIAVCNATRMDKTFTTIGKRELYQCSYRKHII